MSAAHSPHSPHSASPAPFKPDDYEGLKLYWAPSDLHHLRERLFRLGYEASEIEKRDYRQTEFSLTDDDGFSHCFGVATRTEPG